ncbi:hypothetical protein NEOKW01_1549 [Nematocida sp. AWRm80]|nr:hypothetical protein NEOKW01_1549 [Nematocida sp. AWRm80]
MIHPAENSTSDTAACMAMIKELSKEFQSKIKELQENTKKIIKDREDKEHKRMTKLLEVVSDQLNRNLPTMLSSVLQTEIKNGLLHVVEKSISTKLEYKLNDISQACVNSVKNTIEGKMAQQHIYNSIKKNIVSTIVPVIENGMNEIRLQMLEKAAHITLNTDTKPKQCIVDNIDSKDEALDNLDTFVDSLKNEFDYDGIETFYETVTHLLETNIIECFSYVLNSGDPDTFLFFIDQLPLDAEMNLSNALLISFIYHLVNVTELGKPQEYRTNRIKYILLLNNALLHIDQSRLTPEEQTSLRQVVSQLTANRLAFGQTPEEQETLSILQKMSLIDT